MYVHLENTSAFSIVGIRVAYQELVYDEGGCIIKHRHSCFANFRPPGILQALECVYFQKYRVI